MSFHEICLWPIFGALFLYIYISLLMIQMNMFFFIILLILQSGIISTSMDYTSMLQLGRN